MLSGWGVNRELQLMTSNLKIALPWIGSVLVPLLVAYYQVRAADRQLRDQVAVWQSDFSVVARLATKCSLEKD